MILCARTTSQFGAYWKTVLTLSAAYDEEDDGFMFTRGSKRTKTAPTEPQPAPAPEPKPKKTTKKRKERDEEPAATEKKPRGRKMSFSTLKADNDAITVPKKRKGAHSSVVNEQKGESSTNKTALEQTDFDSIDMVGAAGTVDTNNLMPEEVSKHSTVISLPFSDTPIINRNKELRKKGAGTRRSSLGLRGRRASSLIDSGHSAIPHREVETTEFYKHIEAEGLSEPRRMKQLLTWTGERAMGDKPSHGDSDSAAALAGKNARLSFSGARLTFAARVIIESLLADFGNKSEFSDWFNREETAPTKVVKQPNPRNVEIAENLASLEERIKRYKCSKPHPGCILMEYRLREERDQWKALAKPPSSLLPILPDESIEFDASQIDASLLDPEQAAILATAASASALDIRKQSSERLRTIQTGLEFQVDQFADGVHKLEQYQETAGRVANRVLALSAIRLDERERQAKEEVGTRDLPMQEVLRSLSRILPAGGSAR